MIDIPIVMLTIFEKLQGHITRNIRCIFADFKDLNILELLIYFSEPPTQYDEKHINEVLQGIKYDIGNIEINSSLVFTNTTFDKIKKLPYGIFVRAEEYDYLESMEKPL